jgi:sigma-54 specific flagellar transcriptional regulator A
VIVVAVEQAATKGISAVATLSYPLRLQEVLAALHAAAQLRRQRGFDWPVHERFVLRFERMVGNSAAMVRLREAMGKVAGKDIAVLVTGEAGTGKDLVARCLHDASHRSEGPFVPINCGAIPLELLESELFGYERGAFPGAVTTKPGRVELADGGTLLLEAVDELPIPMQIKLLRVLQDRAYERVGGKATLRCNARIMATTQRDLEAMVATGEFREDLFYRLNIFPVHVPTLRERIEDMPMLVTALCRDLEREQGVWLRLDASAMAVLSRHSWPGNVRELCNLLERLAIACGPEVVGANDLPAKFGRAESPGAYDTDPAEVDSGSVLDPDALPLLPVNGLDLKDYLARLEKNLIRQALDDTNDVVARAADRLHIRRTTLVEKMRKYGLSRSESA